MLNRYMCVYFLTLVSNLVMPLVPFFRWLCLWFMKLYVISLFKCMRFVPFVNHAVCVFRSVFHCVPGNANKNVSVYMYTRAIMHTGNCAISRMHYVSVYMCTSDIMHPSYCAISRVHYVSLLHVC